MAKRVCVTAAQDMGMKKASVCRCTAVVLLDRDVLCWCCTITMPGVDDYLLVC